jgi:hypothetical protein
VLIWLFSVVQHVERVRGELLNEMKQSLLSLHRIVDDKIKLTDRKTADFKQVSALSVLICVKQLLILCVVWL